jgi:methanogenic corrinoid protein MtbC1
MKTILAQFRSALLAMDRIEARRILDKFNLGQDALYCVEKLVVPVLEEIGAQWEQGQLPLAQIYMSSRICEELIDRYLPPAAPQRINQPKIAIAILQDYHTLGKSVVRSTLRASGIELQDFGTVDIDSLLSKVIENDIKILLISVLMFSSANHIATLCQRLQQEHPATKVLVGGAPFRFDLQLWEKVGADAVGTNSAEAIKETFKLIEAMS